MTYEDHIPGQPRSVALVSSGPGSGKTLIAATAAMLTNTALRDTGHEIFLMDGDATNAGLTRLLARHRNATHHRDLADFALDHRVELVYRSIEGLLQPLWPGHGSEPGAFLLGLGDPARLAADPSLDLPATLACAVDRLSELAGVLVVDCRAGWGPETLAVCSGVQHIAVVAEPHDVASGALEELERALVEARLSARVLGCVLNKTQLHGADPFAASGAPPPMPVVAELPFDKEAAVAAGQGELPAADGPFCTAILTALAVFAPEIFPGPA
ncbi:hypothetical protein AB0Q95_37400 [Streptomyces sp. NPDC059900]|uniref:hypothetical protein n=1 Tax=Streptomyces sp. NPDC059900 TaxID=3155816 RepID=UPI0034480683